MLLEGNAAGGEAPQRTEPTFDHRYRPEIDGLRSVAVLPVIFYHAGIGPFSGGYVGVDIFFVISGYLITSIILGDIARDRFTIAGFYDRRIRRIFPALFVVTAATMAASFVVLAPEQLRDLGQSVVATMLFLANIFFYLKSGYFAPDVDTFPLIHMWSLAVEEQFYILFPLVLLAIMRYARSWLTAALAVSIVGSFALCVYVQATNPSGAFYLPMYRAWELGIGGLLAANFAAVRAYLSRRPYHAMALETVGLIMIAASIALMSAATPFPGWFALPPVLGTAFIIAASTGTTPVGRMLALPLLVGIGLISYSAYLWHQPLFALTRAWHGVAVPDAGYWALIALTFVLAYLSYRFVEQPFRNRDLLTRRRLFALTAVLTAALVAVGALTHLTRGFPQRFDAERLAVAATMTLSPSRDTCHTDGEAFRPVAEACTYGGPRIAWAVLGDSHGIELGHVIAERLAQDGRGLLHLTFSACPPALGFDPRNPGCARWLEEAVQRLEQSPQIDTVLLAFRHAYHLGGNQLGSYPEPPIHPPLFLTSATPDEARAAYWRGFDQLVRRLSDAGKQVVVLGPVPELPASAEWFVLQAPAGTTVPRAFVNARQGQISARLKAMERAGLIRLIDPERALCDAAACAPVTAGTAMYFDDNHLSLAGARHVLDRERIEAPLP